jgi:hypothetical protein
MRTRVKITDLSSAQWERLELRLRTSYDIPPGIARMCAVFELAPMTERHVEMPVQAFATLMAELAQVGHAETSLAAVSLSGLPALLEDQRNAADPVRAAERAGRPVLPTAAQVRDLTAADAAKLAREMNTGQDADELLDGISEYPSMEGPPE